MATAVLVLDMLTDFTSGRLANPAAGQITKPIAALARAARERDDWLVVYGNDAHRPGDFELAVFGEHAMAGSPGAEVIAELAPQPGDIVVPKRYYSAFTQTDLDATCRVHGISRLVVTGQHTDCCCRHTSYDAFARGIEVVAVSDATARPQPHRRRRTRLRALPRPCRQHHGTAGRVSRSGTRQKEMLPPMNQPGEGHGRRDCGHRSVPHTADLRIEAWGPTREDCIAEAVRGLVESFADFSETTHQRAIKRHLDAGSDADLVAAAVEEVIYYLDTDGTIPAAVEASRADDGGINLTLRVVDAAAAEIIGAAPKAASLSGLTCAPDASGRWLCAVTIDV